MNEFDEVNYIYTHTGERSKINILVDYGYHEGTGWQETFFAKETIQVNAGDVIKALDFIPSVHKDFLIEVLGFYVCDSEEPV